MHRPDQGRTIGAVEIEALHKSFGRLPVLRGLDMEVPEGSICGFLGPNGAGKTTTIRTLLGLVRPDSGSVSVLGHEVPADIVGLRGQVGAVVDRPAVFPPLTGRTNLRVIGDLTGGVPDSRIDALLDLVDLHSAADRKAGTYSHGMRQRLALAGALLAEPSLLVLDEPATGLDPAGQRDLRRILGKCRDGGATVLLSSHLLPEVQMLCDHILIIREGVLIAAGDTDDLLAGASGFSWHVEVGTGNEVEACRALASGGLTANQAAPGYLVVDSDDPAAITRILGEAGIWLRGLTPGGADLESLFLRLTDAPDGLRDEAAGTGPSVAADPGAAG